MSPSPSRGAEIRFLRSYREDVIEKSYVPNMGEPLWIVDTQQFRVGDGVTIGGVPAVQRPKCETFREFSEEGEIVTFTLEGLIFPELLVMISNGLDQTEDDDFTIDGTEVTMTYPLYDGDVVKIRYQVAEMI